MDDKTLTVMMRSTTFSSLSALPPALPRTLLPFPLWGVKTSSHPAKMLPIRDPPQISTSSVWERLLTATLTKEGILILLGLEANTAGNTPTWISQFTKLNTLTSTRATGALSLPMGRVLHQMLKPHR